MADQGKMPLMGFVASSLVESALEVGRSNPGHDVSAVMVLILTREGVFSASAGCSCEKCGKALRDGLEEQLAAQAAMSRGAMN